MTFKNNSKEILPGDTFVAIPGKQYNGNVFIKEAINRGATQIIAQKNNIIEKSTLSLLKRKKISYKYVDDSYFAYAQGVFESHPTTFDELTIIAITGTKGKTSLTYLIYSILRSLGYNSAMMSSAFHEINGIREKATLTTEMINTIQEFVLRGKKSGITHLVIEVSAQALTQHRIYGLFADVFIFNNFCQEHSEYYTSQEEYFKAKKLLYHYLKPTGAVVLNYDDKKVHGTFNLASEKPIYTFSHSNNQASAYYFITKQEIYETKASLYLEKNHFQISTHLLGNHNIANIAAALCAVNHIKKIDNNIFSSISKTIQTIPCIPGRGEKYFLDNNTIIYIDKSYTTNSIKTVLETLRPLTKMLIVVFGCGGERDSQRRPQIAQLIEYFADLIYVSIDNPRYEPQENIFKDISKGFTFNKNIYFYHDRKEAIETALSTQNTEKIIVLLGKGDEKYQDIRGKKIYFSEKEILKINN